MYPYIQWIDYVNDILTVPVTVDKDEMVVYESSSYFADLGKLLQKTSDRTIVNYLVWMAIYASTDMLTDEIRDRKDAFRVATGSIVIRDPRWSECYQSSHKRFDIYFMPFKDIH